MMMEGKIPNLPFIKIKEEILGTDYNLSLVFPTDKLAEKLHKTWKEKDDPANILSFPVGENEGEIFISLTKAKEEYKKTKLTFNNYIKLLFIHGCLHLSGLSHGDIMESKEDELLLRF